MIIEIIKKYEKICEKQAMRYESYMPSAHRKPGHIICQLAQEKGATSVTMGQRGLGTISRALLGSTSGHVLHHSHIPVMIVPSSVMKKT